MVGGTQIIRNITSVVIILLSCLSVESNITACVDCGWEELFGTGFYVVIYIYMGMKSKSNGALCVWRKVLTVSNITKAKPICRIQTEGDSNSGSK
jgi:hypothetical protein